MLFIFTKLEETVKKKKMDLGTMGGQGSWEVGFQV